MAKRTKTAAAAGSLYYTHKHNIDGCLRNGSYVRVDADGRRVQYMNGDFMGDILTVPGGMVLVDAAYAKRLLPKCCK